MTDQDAVSISDELKAFLEGPVSVLVGTRDSRLVPEITRAWGPQISEDRQHISLCVPLATSHKTLDNIESNGVIAVAFCLPTELQDDPVEGAACHGCRAGQRGPGRRRTAS